MCGIFGYIGGEVKLLSLVEALGRLEYRGYDSCGIAAIREGKLFLKKRAGKIHQLKKDLQASLSSPVNLSILHTRWATHGEPNKLNAHPHLDQKKRTAVVHNGIIENFIQIKEELKKQGAKFLSQTDSEVIGHLIATYYNGSLPEAVHRTVKKLKGSFALGVISLAEPDKLIGARKMSPLIVGLGKKGHFLASDMPAILPFTQKVIYLRDCEVAVLEKSKLTIRNFKQQRIKTKVEKIAAKPEAAEKKGYEHFMFKEIFEQPAVLRKILSLYCKKSKISFPNLELKASYLKQIKKVYITACGTAFHAGYVAKYFLEKHCELDVEIDTSSEFRYRKLNLKPNDLLIAISQSG